MTSNLELDAVDSRPRHSQGQGEERTEGLPETRARIFVVEPLGARGLAEFANQLARAFVATTVAGAKQVLATAEAWAAIVIDVELSDGSGLDVLAVARKWHPQTPALVVAGALSSALLNDAFDLGAVCVAKPLEAARLRQFLSATSPKARDPVSDITRRWSVRYRLSKSEADVLLKAAHGSTRVETASSRGSSPHTVQLQQMAVRQKTSDASFGSAVARLLREAAGRR
jgi:FixJ family two-component response regulator